MSHRDLRKRRWQGADTLSAPDPRAPTREDALPTPLPSEVAASGKRKENEREALPSLESTPHRLCGHCGVSIEGRRRHARYCSDACRAKASQGRSGGGEGKGAALASGALEGVTLDLVEARRRIVALERSQRQLEERLRVREEEVSAALAAAAAEREALKSRLLEISMVLLRERGAGREE